MAKIFHFNGLTGTTRAMDAVSVADLSDGDVGFTQLSTGEFYYHTYNATATAAETSPTAIRPNDFTTQGNWIMGTVNQSAIPGKIEPFAMESVPSGYLECDGAAYSRTTYAALFANIGEVFGVGDGSTTFNVPDIRGIYISGWDHGAGNDLDSATRTDSGDGVTTGDHVGTKQDDQFGAHDHARKKSEGYLGSLDSTTGQCTMNEILTSVGGNQTNPKNIALMYCIRY